MKENFETEFKNVTKRFNTEGHVENLRKSLEGGLL